MNLDRRGFLGFLSSVPVIGPGMAKTVASDLMSTHGLGAAASSVMTEAVHEVSERVGKAIRVKDEDPFSIKQYFGQWRRAKRAFLTGHKTNRELAELNAARYDEIVELQLQQVEQLRSVSRVAQQRMKKRIAVDALHNRQLIRSYGDVARYRDYLNEALEEQEKSIKGRERRITEAVGSEVEEAPDYTSRVTTGYRPGRLKKSHRFW